MANTNRILSDFYDEYLSLSAKDIQKSVKSREWALARIQNTIAEESGPQLYAREPIIYFGSFFKDTKVSDVDEFDTLLVIDSCNGVFSESDIQTGKGLGTQFPNPKYAADLMKKNGTGISPTRLLNWLQRVSNKALGSLGVSRPRIDGQAVVVELSGSQLAIDLVPAGIFHSTRDEKLEFYNIPSGSNDGWTVTNPKIDKQLFLECASVREGMKNLTRLVKFVRDRSSIDISSFAIECAVFAAASSANWSQHLTINFMNVVESIRTQVTNGLIADISLPSRNTLTNKPAGQKLVDILTTILSSVLRAMDEEDENKARSLVYNSILNSKPTAKIASNF